MIKWPKSRTPVPASKYTSSDLGYEWMYWIPILAFVLIGISSVTGVKALMWAGGLTVPLFVAAAFLASLRPVLAVAAVAVFVGVLVYGLI